MDQQELMRRIRLGEDSSLELERVVLSGARVTGPARDELADELAAFANGRGGTLVLGVDDRTKELQGIPLERLDAVEAWLRELCNDVLKPALAAHILKYELPDASGRLVPILCVEIPRSLFVHRSPGGYFQRVGSSKRELAPEVLARLFQERSQSRVIRFDETPVPGTSPEDVVPALAQRFLRPGDAPTEVNLRKLRVLADDATGATRVTLAGVLLCTAAPQRALPHAELQAVAYAGSRSDVAYQLDARDIGGPLDEQVAEALHFFRRNVSRPARKALARVEEPLFSERAVFEALVNAVAHRDYSMSGARIRFHLFQDRLELHVPGGLANTLTLDSMELRQYSRNELVVSLLARCPAEALGEVGRSRLMDRRGDGVPIIRAESLRTSGRLPEYTVIDDSELRLVIWARDQQPVEAAPHG